MVVKNIFLLEQELSQTSLSVGETIVLLFIMFVACFACLVYVDHLLGKNEKNSFNNGYSFFNKTENFFTKIIVKSFLGLFLGLSIVLSYISPSKEMSKEMYDTTNFHQNNIFKKDILSFCENGLLQLDGKLNVLSLSDCLLDNEAMLNYYVVNFKKGDDLPSFNKSFNTLFSKKLSDEGLAYSIQHSTNESDFEVFLNDKGYLFLKGLSLRNSSCDFSQSHKYVKKEKTRVNTNCLIYPFTVDSDWGNYEPVIFKSLNK